MDVVTYALSRKYTDKSIEGISGTLTGKNCTIASIEQVEGGNLVTFEWYSDEGESQTSTMFVQDGVLGEDAIAPTYDPTQTYNEGDLVVFENELYKLGAGTTTGEFNPNVWDLTNIENLLNTKVNSNDLSTVATSGSYNDLSDTPTIPDAQIQSDWNQTNTNAKDYIKNKPSIPEDAADISYDNTSSGLEADDVQDAIDEVVADVDAVETALETKAEQNGVYNDLVAGNLLSDSYTADNAPYLYRQSPSASSVEQNIVGGTVAWNQIYNYTIDGESLGVRVLSQNGVVTISGTTTGAGSGRPLAWTDFKAVIGHKYIYLIDFQMPNNSYIMDQYNISTAVNAIGRVFNARFDALIPQLRYNDSGIVFDISNKHLSIIDLTQALGSTIADYLYTIDQANAGAGLAKLQEWGFCTKSNYAYNSGTLMSVNASSHNTVGKNLAEKVIHGYIRYQDGKVVIDNDSESVVFYAIEGKTYVVSSSVEMVRSIVGLANTDNITNQYQLLQMTELANNVNVWTATWTGWTVWYKCPGASSGFANSVQVEFGSTATAYEPYTKHTYPLDSDLTLRGIPKLDANNNLYYDGDIYESDGVIQRKYAEYTFNGLESWSYDGSSYWQCAMSNVPANKYGKTVGNQITSNGIVLKLVNNYYVRAYIADNPSLSGSSNMNTLFASGTKTTYELATPTSETADAYENPQLVGSTEEFIDTRDVPIPVGGERKYHTDLKAKLEELAKIPDVPSTNGTYKLIATRSASGVTYSWESN